MRKLVFLGLCTMLITAAIGAQEKRIYSDGNVDFAPSAARFVLTADDLDAELHEIRYSVNGGESRMYEEPIRLTREGRHVITYRSVDILGNVSGEKVYTVVIDDTPPALAGTGQGAGFVEDDAVYLRSDTTIVLKADDELSGVDGVYVSLDGEDFRPFRGVGYINEEGEHTGYAYAVDNVGNRSRTFSVRGWVDNTPPEVRIVPQRPLTSVGGRQYSIRGNQFSLRASDEISGVDEILVSLNGSEFATYSGPVTITDPGRYVLRAKAVDRLGNESETVERRFTVESRTPQPQLRAIIEE
jgi:hypothetical protein